MPKLKSRKAGDHSALVKHWEEAERILNREMRAAFKQEALDFEVQFRFPQKNHTPAISEWRAFEAGDRLYKPTLETVANTLVKLLSLKHIALHGLVQSTKTASQAIGSRFHSIIHYLRTDIFTLPIILVPNKTEHIGQFQEKFHNLDLLLKDTEVRCRKPDGKWSGWLSLREYFSDLSDTLQETGKEYGQQHPDEKKRRKLVRQFREHFGNDGPLVLGISRKNFDLILMLAKIARTEGMCITLWRDESHWGMDGHNLTGELFNQPIDVSMIPTADDDEQPDAKEEETKKEEEAFDNNLYQLFHNEDGRFLYIGCSATNWHSILLEPVYIRLSPEYCGLDYYLGHRFTALNGQNLIIREPRFHTLRSLDQSAGTHLAGWKPQDFKDADHDDLRLFAKDLAKAFKYLRMAKKDSPKHRMMICRLVNHNGATITIKKFLENAVHKGVKVVAFYGQAVSSFKSLLSEAGVGPDDEVIILCTARARMGDSLPVACGYGLDFTRRATNLQSLIQGITGRLCGYGKDPDIYLSDANMYLIRDYINNMGRLRAGKLSPLVVDGPDNQIDDQVRVIYDLNRPGQKGDKILTGIFKRLQKVIARHKNEDGLYSYEFGKYHPLKLNVSHLFTEQEYKYLNASLSKHHPDRSFHPQTRLLSPGEIDEKTGTVHYLMTPSGVVLAMKGVLNREGKPNKQFGATDKKEPIEGFKLALGVEYPPHRWKDNPDVPKGYVTVDKGPKAAKIVNIRLLLWRPKTALVDVTDNPSAVYQPKPASVTDMMGEEE